GVFAQYVYQTSSPLCDLNLIELNQVCPYVSFLLSYLQHLCFDILAKRQTNRIRIKVFQTTLNKVSDVIWYDTDGGEPVSSL
ncbi:unnamed protein product, partial [Didymodactylos carnosus]